MSKFEINATKSSVRVSAAGSPALALGAASACFVLAAAIYFFPIW
jgi:hypothetical protein